MDTQNDWLDLNNLPGYPTTVNCKQRGSESLLHRQAMPAHESNDGDGDSISSITSSVNSTSSSSGCSYSEDSTAHLEKTSDDNKMIPAWFKKGPYMYNGRTFVISIPGLLLVLAFGGETLLTVITCGGLVVHLYLRSGNKTRSLEAYGVMVICVQIIVIYSVLPLLWKSLYTYAVIVPAVNTFSVMTGAWLLLAFDNFTYHEAELAQYIEVLLFTLYPVLCSVILTWLSLVLIPSIYAPYVFILTGFVILQFYLIPMPSSYRKPIKGQKDDCNVLEPAFPACIALVFCWMPLSVFLVITAATDFSQLFQVVTVVECFFITTLSIFLATFFNLRQFLEDAGLSYYGVKITRKFCGNASMLGFCLLLYCRHVLSHLLPWLPIAIILHMAFGALWSCRKKKLYLQVVTATLCVYYTLLFRELPWTLDYHIASGNVVIGVVFTLLFGNCLMTVLCMYASLYFSTETFGSLLLLQTLGFVFLEQLLLRSELYSLLLMAAVTAFLIYVVLRLHYSKKLLWQPALAIVSVHLTVLWNGIAVTYPYQVSTNWMVDVFDFLAAWLLLATLCKTYVFLWAETVSEKQTQIYITVSGLISLVAAHAFVPKLAWLLAGRKELCVADILAFSSTVVTLVSSKLGICHHSPWKPNKRIGTISVALTVLLISVQPACQLTRFDILKWLLIGSTICGILVVARAMALNSMTRLHLASFVIGFPAGLALVALMYDDGVTSLVLVHLLYGLLTSVCVELALATWTPVRNLEAVVISRLGVLLMTSLSLSVMDWFTKPTTQVGSHFRSPGLLGLAGSFLIAAAILKTISFLEDSEVLTAHGSIRKSKLPIVGNMLTVVAFISVCSLQPLPHWENWLLCRNDNKHATS
ncbi:hypothetical protein LSAT2_008770 [Lamellibrachia satsuma]|nr:hypothetical protein LSAT2_008770 [Lamellibrachia satsuma]